MNELIANINDVSHVYHPSEIIVNLVISFILSDFSNETVYNNSHTTKPLFYKISGTWGNHEGSLLLWLLVLVIFIFLFSLTSKKHPKK